MIRAFETQDMNPLVKFIANQSEQIGGNVFADADQDNIIKFIKQRVIVPGSAIFLSEHANQIRGYACVQSVNIPWNGKKVCMINVIYVAPEFRNGHTTNFLYDEIETWAKQHDCKAIINTVIMYDDQFKPQQDFIDTAHAYFGRKMTECGRCYVKEIV